MESISRIEREGERTIIIGSRVRIGSCVISTLPVVFLFLGIQVLRIPTHDQSDRYCLGGLLLFVAVGFCFFLYLAIVSLMSVFEITIARDQIRVRRFLFQWRRKETIFLRPATKGLGKYETLGGFIIGIPAGKQMWFLTPPLPEEEVDRLLTDFESFRDKKE